MRLRSSTSPSWASPCGCCLPTSWPPASTAGTRCPSSTGMRHPIRWSGSYRTSDGRFITLMMLQSDRFWPDFCAHIGRPDLIEDPRFADGAARYTNGKELRRRSSTRCSPRGPTRSGSRHWRPWRACGPRCSLPSELADDPQVGANGYLAHVQRDDGKEYDLVTNPVQMDETGDQLSPAPEHGQHTEEILLELGLGLGRDRGGQGRRLHHLTGDIRRCRTRRRHAPPRTTSEGTAGRRRA